MPGRPPARPLRAPAVLALVPALRADFPSNSGGKSALNALHPGKDSNIEPVFAPGLRHRDQRLVIAERRPLTTA